MGSFFKSCIHQFVSPGSGPGQALACGDGRSLWAKTVRGSVLAIVLFCYLPIAAGSGGGGESTPEVIQQGIDLCRRLLTDPGASNAEYHRVKERLNYKANKTGRQERRDCLEITQCMQRIVQYLYDNRRCADVIKEHLAILQDVPKRKTTRLRRTVKGWCDAVARADFLAELQRFETVATEAVADRLREERTAPVGAPRPGFTGAVVDTVFGPQLPDDLVTVTGSTRADYETRSMTTAFQEPEPEPVSDVVIEQSAAGRRVGTDASPADLPPLTPSVQVTNSGGDSSPPPPPVFTKQNAVKVLVIILVLNLFYRWYNGEVEESWLGKFCTLVGKGAQKVFGIIEMVLSLNPGDVTPAQEDPLPFDECLTLAEGLVEKDEEGAA